MSQIWPKFRPQSSSDCRIFELGRFIGKQKQSCQARPIIGLPPHQTWVGGSTQFPEPLAQWIPQRVKVENFLYILHSSGPRRVQRHQCYTTCLGRSCCKKATVPYLPIRPYSSQGVTQKGKVKNFLYILRSSGPRWVHRHQCYTTYWGRSWCKKITVPYLSIRLLYFSGGQKSAAPTRVNLRPVISRKLLEFYTHIDRAKCTFWI